MGNMGRSRGRAKHLSQAEYLENENNFLNEIKTIFRNRLRTFCS